MGGWCGTRPPPPVRMPAPAAACAYSLLQMVHGALPVAVLIKALCGLPAKLRVNGFGLCSSQSVEGRTRDCGGAVPPAGRPHRATQAWTRRREEDAVPQIGHTRAPSPWCLPAPTNLDRRFDGGGPDGAPSPVQRHGGGSPLRLPPMDSWPTPHPGRAQRVPPSTRHGPTHQPHIHPAGTQPRTQKHTHTHTLCEGNQKNNTQ